MNNWLNTTSKNNWLGLAGIIGFVALGYATYHFYGAAEAAQSDLASTTAAYASSTAEWTAKLGRLESENEELREELEEEQDKNNDFERQIKKIAGTVGDLEKLSKTDKQLLQKYSKVYFLNEHYLPSQLALIDKDYWANPDKPLEIHAGVWPHLEELLEEAAEDGVALKIASAYRSFGTQAVLKNSYRVTYGAGTANQFSADQGYSEHQLGTTVDFTTPALGSSFDGFGSTEAYTWLTKNAHRYGFILSYPPNNSYYQYEPWHWRFVGEDLARQLYRDGQYFYDWDQREIDEYLINFFD